MYLIDATPLESEHRERGVGTYVRWLAQSLIRIAPGETRFILTSNGLEFVPSEVQQRSWLGRRSHRPAQVYWMYNEIFLRRALRQCGPDVFHATDFNGLVTMPGIPTVATLHDVMALKNPSPGRTVSSRLSALRWDVYFRKLHQARFIITVSDAVKQDAVNYLGLDPAIITTIHPGVNVSQFSPASPRPDARVKSPYFLCVGACDANKNYERVVQAFSRATVHHPNVRLVIAGRWQHEQGRWLEELSGRFNVTDRIDHLGFVPTAELASLYAYALGFVFPSLDEGFGSPIVESMASGTPFITSNQGALKEVSGSCGILVDPRDVQALTRAMLDLIERPRLREMLAEKGLQRSKMFSWDEVAERTLAVYDRALSSSPSTA